MAVNEEIFYEKDNLTIPEHDSFLLYAKDIPELKIGSYFLNVTFTPKGGTPITRLGEISVDMKFTTYNRFYDEWNEVYSLVYLYPYGEEFIKMQGPKSMNGIINYFFDGAWKSIEIKNGEAIFTIHTSTLKMGDHYMMIDYVGKSKSIQIKMEPIFVYSIFQTAGQENYVDVILADGYSGMIYAFEDDEGNMGAMIGQGNVVNGRGTMLLPSIKGDVMYHVCFNSSDYDFTDVIDIYLIENDPKIRVSVSGEVEFGSPVAISIEAPLGTGQICVDGMPFGIFEDVTSINTKVSGLAVGKHRISIIYATSSFEAFSGIFYVTVKQKANPSGDLPKVPAKKADKVKLVLKKVKVKRSAKKLILTATLKINGKAKKGLKVTFKFNGKKFTAKTNAKGIAKVKITKKFLKKLKVGKKVKYQASYAKTVKKVTVKVKR